ncbi:hypothetical protein D3C72_1533550 [compost metagenome]
MAAEGGAERRARFHIATDVIEQLGHAGVGAATTHNVKGLQQWHACLHHGRQLAGKERNILGFDLLARAHTALLDLGRQNALSSQGRDHLIFAAGAGFAAHDLAVAVFTLPLVNGFVRCFLVDGCCHFSLPSLLYSLVTARTSSSEVNPFLTL